MHWLVDALVHFLRWSDAPASYSCAEKNHELMLMATLLLRLRSSRIPNFILDLLIYSSTLLLLFFYSRSPLINLSLLLVSFFAASSINLLIYSITLSTSLLVGSSFVVFYAATPLHQFPT
jgi:hypothetical protein